MASASDSRLTALAVPLAMSLARDSREAESLLRARSEEMLFLGIVRRREQALQEAHVSTAEFLKTISMRLVLPPCVVCALPRSSSWSRPASCHMRRFLQA